MKKINDKGFTLIELLAVIVIMGILMMVAIPAVSRTIENSRKDTYVDVAKQYVSAVKTMWAADGLRCRKNSEADSEAVVSSAVEAGTASGIDYFIGIDTQNPDSYPVLLEQGGTSPWGNRRVKGYVIVNVKMSGDRIKTSYSIAITDGVHAILKTDNPVRGSVTTDGTKVKYDSFTISSAADVRVCQEI